MTRVTISDVRAAGFCVRGARDWFARHGLDLRAFLQNGIDEQEALETGDALAVAVIKHKRERERPDG